jgi:hypothetical protein
MDYLLLPPEPDKPKEEVPVKAPTMSEKPATEPVGREKPAASGERMASDKPAHAPKIAADASHPQGQSPTRGLLGDSEASHPQGDSEVRREEKPPELEIYEDSLIIQDWESKFAARLFELIPTPRAAKRFSNTYRILKAPLRHDSLAEFEGTARELGAFQVPMLLLAISIGAPAEAADLFPKLLQYAIGGENPTEKLRRIAGFAALQDKIQPILANPLFPSDPRIYLEWIPRVSRFSFEAGRAIRRQETAAASA